MDTSWLSILKFIAIGMASIQILFGIPNNIDSLRKMYQQPSKYWQKPDVDIGVAYEELAPLPKFPPFPADNPYTKTKAELGKKLFNDARLSLSGKISCASCHDAKFGFGDDKRVSYGHNQTRGKRNSPSIVMSAFGKEKFWDGRASNLENQALFPIQDKAEMAFNLCALLNRLNSIKEYQELFKNVFKQSRIDAKQISQALSTYERTLMPKPTRFDRFLNGDFKALDDKEIWGLHLFRTKARCLNCHYGTSFSDEKYHNLGLTYYGRKYQDLGRYEITKNPKDVGAFKTPSLRWVSKTAPYMHNGLFPTIRGILNAYNAGMFNPKPTYKQKSDPLFPKTSKLLRPLHLDSEELEALEAFLKTI